MSAHISESKAGFVGILNGVMYRFDPDAKASVRGLTGFVPITAQPMPPAHWTGVAAAPRTSSTALRQARAEIAGFDPGVPSPEAQIEQARIDQARVEKEARAARLFKREGPEPLRAGHPELWALLVAGTCLEGSSYGSDTKGTNAPKNDRPSA